MKNTRFMSTAALAITVATGLASGASAATLDLENISVSWNTVVGGSSTEISNSFGGNDLLSYVEWGSPAGGGQIFENPIGTKSGYKIQVDSDPVPQPPETVPGAFDFGEFTHFNNPISSGTAIDSVQLSVTGDVVLDRDPGGGTTIMTGAAFNFLFGHDETDNSCQPQPSCADDLVEVSILNDTSTVNVDGTLYTLRFLGFLQDGQLVDVFRSPESTSTSGTLRAEFTSDVPSQIPLPAAGWMLLAGIGGLAALRRRKKA